MSLVRSHIATLSNNELWELFDQMETFERTMVVPEVAELRTIASQFMSNTAMAMTIVGQEVWRELAVRGCPTAMENIDK